MPLDVRWGGFLTGAYGSRPPPRSLDMPSSASKEGQPVNVGESAVGRIASWPANDVRARRVGAHTPTISVVIPTLNEAPNLPHVFARLPHAIDEVVIVDGHSIDDTVAVARALRPDVRIVLQDGRVKGNALACGIAVATGDIIVMLDADGSTDPAEIPRFVDALLNGGDFAKGTRFRDGGGSADITRVRRVGNRVLVSLVNLLFGTSYSDLCYGYNAFWSR